MESIQNHAIIGDCRSAALVSSAGSIDWLCWPAFDSPPIFGALVDDAAGEWLVRPTNGFQSVQGYLEGTNVLETRFETAEGKIVLTDLMPVATEEQKRASLVPEHELLRIVRCEAGDVEIDLLFQARLPFGRKPPKVRNNGKLGVHFEAEQGLMILRGDAPLEPDESGVIRTRFRLRGGTTACFSLTFAEETAIVPLLGDRAKEALHQSVRWWRDWLAQLTYSGPERGAVERSALALKLLVFAPSGAIVAAPTTSLPERLGGGLNWDYRFCWLRDAALTSRALFGLGFREEAEAFVSWLLHSTRLTRPALRVLYDVHGNEPPAERELAELSGYRGSRPVRTGNEAAHQLQLDVYGEVIDAVAQAVWSGVRLDGETQRMLEHFGTYVCRHWQQPDEGIWEPRSGRNHNTHSRVLCWVALDRLLELYRQGRIRRIPAERFALNREMIRREVTERAWRDELGSYVSTLGGDDLDASTLLLAWYGFEPASSDRMRRTYQRIRQRLGAGRSLLYRYWMPEAEREGAFGICSFWGAEYLALGGGSLAEAQSAFEQLCHLGSATGLHAEEVDPITLQALGNFPQAFTHVGLINAALSLRERRARERGGSRNELLADP